MNAQPWTYTLFWANRFQTCPGERVLISVDVAAGSPCPESVLKKFIPGNGYSIGLNLNPVYTERKLSQSGLSSVRRKRITRKLERKYPLFASQLIDREISARPEYFAGVRS